MYHAWNKFSLELILTCFFPSGEGDNIRVYVRVRPPSKHLETDVDRTPCLEVTSGNTVVLYSKPDAKNFSFDHVADINTTQVQMFDWHLCCIWIIMHTFKDIYSYFHNPVAGRSIWSSWQENCWGLCYRL